MKTLDFNTRYETSYCIPLWLRDEQIQHSIRRVAKRIEPGPKRTEPVAIVGFGPSLNDTWRDVCRFQRIVTCSGAHRFLLDRGIVPTWHVEVDPRPHKVPLLGEPHPDVKYLVSSTCHPAYFDHLLGKGADVTLWHVFSNDKEAYRVLPRGEWALTGGTDVGMRCMTIARFLGFTDQHIFGIDGSFREEGKRHAAEHPYPLKGAPLHYEGRDFLTTAAMLESAKMVFHELDQMPDVKGTFYGDGLVQHMAHHIERKPVPIEKAVIGFAAPELISAEYRDLNRQLHEARLDYGVGGGRHVDTVVKLAATVKTTSVLDYGCGKGYLARAMPFPIWEYDPAVPGKDAAARPADLVCCFDVLEHVEPEKILWVLDDLRRCTLKLGYFVIHTGPSSKQLADGRNAHILQRPRTWWEAELAQHFRIGKVFEVGPLLHVVVTPRPAHKRAVLVEKAGATP